MVRANQDRDPSGTDQRRRRLPINEDWLAGDRVDGSAIKHQSAIRSGDYALGVGRSGNLDGVSGWANGGLGAH